MPLFDHAQDIVINGGNFNDFSTNGLDPLVFLEQCSAPGAMHDSMERFPPPRCHAETRKRALGIIEHWGTLPRVDREKRFFWLHAPVGMGKTTIAQTIAEEFEAKNILGASFFFSRTDANRNRAERFVASLALQLAISIPTLKPHVGAALRANPAILRKALPIQLQKLIIEPFRKIPPLEDDKVVAIDGLDECEGTRPDAQDKEKEQLLILHLIETMLDADLPLNFFLASRPEAWIQEALEESPSLSDTTQRLDLFEDSEKGADVERYFRDHLERIRHSKRHRLCFSKLTEPWPPEDIVQDIIGIASGQFAYVDVIIRCLDDPYSNPVVQLKAIIRRTSHRDSHHPMQQLDDLYRQILGATPNRDEMMKALAWIVFNPRPQTTSHLLFRAYDTIMGSEPGDMARALRGLHALVRVPNDDVKDAWSGDMIFHRSLVEFLRTPVRAKTEFFLDNYWPFLARYRCLVYLSENPVPSPSTLSERKDIYAYAKEFRPSEGWCYIYYGVWVKPDFSHMVLRFARLFLAYDPGPDILGFRHWSTYYHASDVEEKMVESYHHFSAEPSLLRECFIHWRTTYHRQLDVTECGLGSQDRLFLYRVFDALHSVGANHDAPQQLEFKYRQPDYVPELRLQSDDREIHGFLSINGLSMHPRTSLAHEMPISLVSLVYTTLPIDFYHLVRAVQPRANGLLECAPRVINTMWTDLLRLKEPHQGSRSQRLTVPRRMFSMLHLIRSPDKIDLLKAPCEAARLWDTGKCKFHPVEHMVRREIIRCALDMNMPMALAISTWWKAAITTATFLDSTEREHYELLLREANSFISRLD
ncbi:NWD2 [Coprinopsis cinerea okayama7|uniref:NWD2 n=1 Tax=Coprinopsis cinerea (strain Okayama-7 / 130 / ATCC MYA-4618 / FGSC 9003) TaxID=240176 RepID=A8N0U8_COPC7|nr:NWD2 [Coprinopsis cinerea okayama7\|eukprot:XP_001828499.2 NWD2 [Coprinopsis cinerea okayama7\